MRHTVQYDVFKWAMLLSLRGAFSHYCRNHVYVKRVLNSVDNVRRNFAQCRQWKSTKLILCTYVSRIFAVEYSNVCHQRQCQSPACGWGHGVDSRLIGSFVQSHSYFAFLSIQPFIRSAGCMPRAHAHTHTHPHHIFTLPTGLAQNLAAFERRGDRFDSRTAVTRLAPPGDSAPPMSKFDIAAAPSERTIVDVTIRLKTSHILRARARMSHTRQDEEIAAQL
jgi:hypothetical protein